MATVGIEPHISHKHILGIHFTDFVIANVMTTYT
jgi:hypothetical protein